MPDQYRQKYPKFYKETDTSKEESIEKALRESGMLTGFLPQDQGKIIKLATGIYKRGYNEGVDAVLDELDSEYILHPQTTIALFLEG